VRCIASWSGDAVGIIAAIHPIIELVVNNSDYDFGNNRDNDFRISPKKKRLQSGLGCFHAHLFSHNGNNDAVNIATQSVCAAVKLRKSFEREALRPDPIARPAGRRSFREVRVFT